MGCSLGATIFASSSIVGHKSGGPLMLDTLDLSRSLTKEEYRAVVDPLEIRLGELQRTLRADRIPTVLVFEGWDAAGKGTCMAALMQPLDPRGYRVHGDHRA